jgi:3',5'-cyclic-AMP phosphodiesterase
MQRMKQFSWLLAAAFVAAVLGLRAAAGPDSFRFVLLGDRTGEPVAGVYERIWREVAAEKPAFVLSVGDTIQGGNDATARQEWEQVWRILAPFRQLPLYLTPGNHDIWSPLSEQLFRKYSGHPPHYSFDYGEAHFTILDNSRSDQFSPEEWQFLRQDLEQHADQPLKLVVSHRPSWLLDAVLSNAASPLQQLAKRYGIRYIVAGHVHQMLEAGLDGVTYVSLPSAGGHLRLSARYEDGWFFGHTLVMVHGASVEFQVREAQPPLGQGRVTALDDWGPAGLRKSSAAAR